jgi:predicted RNA-binding Zn ribbon-like protein
MSSDATLARLTPYLEEVLENGYARDQLREGAIKLRSALDRSRKARVKPATDRKLLRDLKAAATELGEGVQALASGRRKPKRRWPKRLLVVVLGGGLAAGAAYALNAGAGDRVDASGVEG